MKEIEMLFDFFRWMESTPFKKGLWRILVGSLFWIPLYTGHELAFGFMMIETAAICVWLPGWGLLCWTAGIVEWARK